MDNVVMDVLSAVVEWRQARQAFFDVEPVGSDPTKRFPEKIWARLSNAEDRLMKLAGDL